MKKKIYLDVFALPVLVLALIVTAEILDNRFAGILPFPAALIPLFVAGGYVCYDTLLTLWRSRRITAGILVVLALIGCIYTGEYMEGAEVSLMMILGESLEHFAVEKTRLTVNVLVSNLSTDRHHLHNGFGGNAKRLTDRFSGYFLPLIFSIGVLTYFLTKDIHRVMTIFVIACPCSLMLSSPIAVLTCTGNAARHGILLTDGEIVEQCGMIRSVTFDETSGLYVADNGLTLGASPAADVLFTADEKASLSHVLSLTKKTRMIIWENILLFAFLVNLIGILLSGLGLLGPVPGAVLHNASSICVVLNSLRLMKDKD